MSRILIVDDEVDELEAWRAPLRRAKHTVDTSSSADQALEACDHHSYDLVILDYLLPSMKGLELLCRIRKKLPLVRSILISGKLDKNVTEKQLRELIREEVETDKYLHKPVSNRELIEAVSSVLALTEAKSWDDMAKRFADTDKVTVRKARSAQHRLKKHLKKG